VLRDDINNALKEAMKAKNERAVSTLRMVNSSLKNADIEARGAGKPPLGDAETLSLLQKMIKQRQESVELYQKGGRDDLVRQEPVLTVSRITCRRDPIWQALLPGGGEHRTMMGMPREPTIHREVSRAGVRCLDVHIGPGGCSWLHAVVQIDKQHEDDGRQALVAAFRGHRSLKHAFVVDADIDPYDPREVEWALATRFQADRDLLVVGREPGSSLDPSAEGERSLTCKVGFDLTRPLGGAGKSYQRAAFPAVKLEDYLQPGRGPEGACG
jgi:hypothetical protein